MGMGFPVGMGFPWDGNEKHISMGMGMGMGMISVGVGMTKNTWFKNSHLLSDLGLLYYSSATCNLYRPIVIFRMRRKGRCRTSVIGLLNAFHCIS